MKMKRILIGCLVALMSLQAGAQLKFRNDGTFKIVQFTDVHWVPGNAASNEAAERMNEVLDAEKPDLVVYTGDLVFAKPASVCLDEALKPAVSRGIPFAVTFGNHDDEQDMTRQQLLEYISKKER
jgi:Predicted phosphohydrolases